MKNGEILKKGAGTHKPLVGGSNPPATTITLRSSSTDQGNTRNPKAYSHTSSDQGIHLKQAVENFLLSCKVEGKSYGTIECYSDKLKGFSMVCQEL